MIAKASSVFHELGLVVMLPLRLRDAVSLSAELLV
jgi:hypothetical protein